LEGELEYGLSAERPQCLRRRLWGQWFVEPRGDLPFQPVPSSYNKYRAPSFINLAASANLATLFESRWIINGKNACRNLRLEYNFLLVIRKFNIRDSRT
jgi:hypothetical protein